MNFPVNKSLARLQWGENISIEISDKENLNLNTLRISTILLMDV